MRLFVAANFDAQLSARLYAAAGPLREAVPDVAWVTAERLHTTLKFLGEQDASFVARLAEALRAFGAATHPIDASIATFGAFPNFRRPRVVWIGIEPSVQLAALAGGVDSICGTFGIAREGRPFRAHVTLGRVKRPLDRTAAQRLEQAARARHEVLHWHVGTVEIMHSTLGAKGPAYVPLASIELGQKS